MLTTRCSEIETMFSEGLRKWKGEKIQLTRHALVVWVAVEKKNLREGNSKTEVV